MKTIEIIKVLESMNKKIFTINDISKIIKKSKKYTSLFVYRLKKKGLILEIEKKKYILKNTSNYTVFSNIIYPSYISFLTALGYYNLTSQIPKKIYIVSLKSKKEIRFENYSIKFIKFRPKIFFGYKREKTSDGLIFIAEIEKAIIDSLFLPKYCSIDETYKALSESIGIIDLEKLIEYSLKMESGVVIKRLGFLLEKNGIDIFNKVNKIINNKYDPLDTISKKGIKNKKWKLIINRNLEQNVK